MPQKMLKDSYNDVTDFIETIKNHDYVARITPVFLTNKEIMFGFQYQDNYLHSLYQCHATTIINHYRNFLGIPHFSISTRDAIFPSGYQNDYFYYLIDPAFIPDKFKNAFCQAHNLSQLDENSKMFLLETNGEKEEDITCLEEIEYDSLDGNMKGYFNALINKILNQQLK